MELINAIKKPELRRIFGEKELKIIEKQLMGVQLMPSERTRLSRDIRKKLEAVQLLSNFVNEFRLKRGIYLRKLIIEAKDEIIKHPLFPRVRRIIIFGTAAENRLRLGSDIDIAVEFDKINNKEAFKFRLDIKSTVDKKLDIQVYNILPKEIKDEIDKRGKTIFEKKN